MKMLLFFFALIFGVQPALAQAPTWTVTDVGGAAEVQRDGTVQRLRRGVRLEPGDTVVTGTNGRVSLGRGREFIVMSPATRLSIPTAAQQEGGLVQIIQQVGRAIFSIERRTTPHFSVRTPHLAAIVRGTTFTVTVDEVEGCQVAVSEGQVQVTTHDGHARQLVDPGMQVRVPPGGHHQIIIERVDSQDGEAQ